MLRLNNISVTVNNFALRNISFSVESGEYFVILGPSGAGKTLLLETIAGLLKIDEGDILINGKSQKHVPSENRNIGICYQDYVLFPHLNVFGNIAYGMKMKKLSKKDIKIKTENILSLLNIDYLANRSVHTLSGGEAQRVALGRAIALNPSLLLLDEPLNALDVTTKEYLERQLKKLNRDYEQTIIHVTHDFEEALNLASKIGIMNDGQIVQVGTPDDVFRKPESEFVANFLGGENLFKAQIIAVNGVKYADIENVRFQIGSVNDKTEGFFSIREDEIILSYDKIESSARNCFRGLITEIRYRGILAKVTIDVGIPLVSLVTKKSLEEMHIECRKEMYCTFKATAVHIF